MWGAKDHALLSVLNPDVVLFVGDLGEGDLRLINSIRKLPFPTAVVLGNHDRGKDSSGAVLESQLRLLGDLHCGWNSLILDKPRFSLVGARPCSAGGGFHLSRAVEAVYGPLTIHQSVNRITSASESIPEDYPFVLLAHSGPTGLGADPSSICGRDWKQPYIDWGDKDLELAIDQLKMKHAPDLVVFGHMHHNLKAGRGLRTSFIEDKSGIYYLNAACVPRRFIDSLSREVTHFAWVEFEHDLIKYIGHRWYLSDGQVAYEETLLDKS